MADNQPAEANSRVNDVPRSFTGDHIVNNDSRSDQARRTVEDTGNNLLDALPGRGTE